MRAAKTRATPPRHAETPDAAPAVAPAVAPQRRLYLRVRSRVLLSVLFGLLWAGVSTWLAQPWIHDLSDAIGPVLAWGVILGIALVPGYLNAQLLAAVMMDRPRSPVAPTSYPDLSVIVAAYNEESRIAQALRALAASDYPGSVEFVVIDDGSSDGTVAVVADLARRDDRVRLVRAQHHGKAQALNAALATVDAPLVATVDADTTVTVGALRRAVSRLLSSPPDTVAVAGSVLVANVEDAMLTRTQRWDYLVGIASVKRAQALEQGTLVAQGAFSVYRPEAVREAGGWPDLVGEDIVLTWAMLRNGGRVGYEPTAIAFTEVPTETRAFLRQRRRWARGMVEGLRTHGRALLFIRRPFAHAIWVDQLLPFLDAAYSLAVPTGIVLALTGRFWIIGPMTLAVLPVNLAISGLLFARQRRAMAEVGIKVHCSGKDYLGLGGFFLFYQLLVSPVALSGYVAELLRRHKRW
jgi:poly-beta-1,6-N-acetyl-D-glucosamine synthase